MRQRPVRAGGEQFAEVVVVSRHQYERHRHAPQHVEGIPVAEATGGKIARADHHVCAAAFVHDRLGLGGIAMQIAEGKDPHADLPVMTVATPLISRSATSALPASSASPIPV